MSVEPARVSLTACARCVVVRDLHRGESRELTRQLGARHGPGAAAAVLVLAHHADRRELVQLLIHGFRGGVTSVPGSSGAPIRIVRLPAAAVSSQRGMALSARELGVLILVADGLSNRAIGDELGLSAHTVKSHLARISRKLGPGDRAALVATVIRRGLIT